MCAPTPPSPTLWITTTGPTHHQKSVIVIVTACSKLCLLLHRCLTPAPAATVSPRQNLRGPRTYRRIQPLALSKVENSLLRRAHTANSPTASNPDMGITQTSRIRDTSLTRSHFLPKGSTVESRRKTFSGVNSCCWVLLRR